MVSYLSDIGSGGRPETGFLVLHKQSSIACKRFSAAREVFLYEKPGFLAPTWTLTVKQRPDLRGL